MGYENFNPNPQESDPSKEDSRVEKPTEQEQLREKRQRANQTLTGLTDFLKVGADNKKAISYDAKDQEWRSEIHKALAEEDRSVMEEKDELIEPMFYLASLAFNNSNQRELGDAIDNLKQQGVNYKELVNQSRETFNDLAERYATPEIQEGYSIPQILRLIKQEENTFLSHIRKMVFHSDSKPEAEKKLVKSCNDLFELESVPPLELIYKIDDFLQVLSEDGVSSFEETERIDETDEHFKLTKDILPSMKILSDLRDVLTKQVFGKHQTPVEVTKQREVNVR